MVTAIVFSFALAAADAKAPCAEVVAAGKTDGAYAVAPLSCAPGLEEACARVLHEMVTCLKARDLKVISPGAVTHAVDERALQEVIASADTLKLKKLGDILAIKYMVVGEVTGTADAPVALMRLIGVEDGKILNAARLSAQESSSKPVRRIGDISEEAIEATMRRLADKLVAGYDAVSPARYRRWAVLDFRETTPLAKERSVGTLVSGELVTQLSRAHQLMLVERSRLSQVVQEHELGQLGLIDEASAPKLGKFAGADAIVLGTINESGGQFVVYAQVIDVQTSATVVAESVALKAEGLIALSSDAVVLRSKAGAVYRSLLLVGWGQFYNGQPQKAVTMIGIVGGLAAAAIGTHIGGAVAQAEYARLGIGGSFNEVLARAESLYLARNILLIGCAVAWAYNILDAYLNGITFDSAVTTKSASVRAGPLGIGGSF
jgi:TolB-like protein